MKLTRWGIIGPGNIARTFTKDLAYSNSPQQVVAVLGHNAQNTFDFASEFDIPDYYTHIEEFLKNKNMDAVYIATPHPQHHEQSLACLNNKLPVLCEKPMTINAQQCKELIEAAQN